MRVEFAVNLPANRFALKEMLTPGTLRRGEIGDLPLILSYLILRILLDTPQKS